MRTRSDLAAIPVILQTAVGGAEFEDEGLRAGAFYYLEKPYPGPLLASVLEEALHPNREPSPPSAPSERPARQVFHVRTLEDARAVATEIAELCPQPERAFLGLLELIVNAVEHGNLGISYAEKTALCAAGRWEGEIRRRLALPENTEKAVEVRFEHHSGESHIWIRDAGAGFNWPAYVATDAARAADPHGRGIALARTVSFDWLEYLGNGSEVHAVIHDVDPRSPGRSRGVGVAD